ncbi:MAG: hypothetical protein WEC12_01925 [Balneolaceae bacterium]
MFRSDTKETEEIFYRQRVMAGIVSVLILLLLIVKFWPVREKNIQEQEPVVFDEQVLIDDIEITRRNSSPPPPPRPDIPQPVPDDEIIEDYIEFEEFLDLADLPELPPESGSGRFGDDDTIISEPQLPPSVVRIVEPSVPDLPDELRGRIEMLVNFLVNQEGAVEEASIVQIRKYCDESRDDYEVLPYIEYGLMGATLEAALSWRFRAARHEGAGVRTYTTATFNY